MRFRPINDEIEISCTGTVAAGATAELSGPVTIQMIAEKPRKLQYDPPEPFDEGPDAENRDWQAAGGLAFEPIISGAMAGARTAPENATVEGDVVSPYKYAGIVTPKEEWCTDTCGVATIEVWPVCIGSSTNTVSINLHSGGVFSDQTSIKLTHGATQ